MTTRAKTTFSYVTKSRSRLKMGSKIGEIRVCMVRTRVLRTETEMKVALRTWFHVELDRKRKRKRTRDLGLCMTNPRDVQSC